MAGESPSRSPVPSKVDKLPNVKAEGGLPYSWNHRHDKAICYLDLLDVEVSQMILRLKDSFPESFSAVFLHREAIEARLLILDQNIECVYFKDALQKIYQSPKPKQRSSTHHRRAFSEPNIARSLSESSDWFNSQPELQQVEISNSPASTTTNNNNNNNNRRAPQDGPVHYDDPERYIIDLPPYARGPAWNLWNTTHPSDHPALARRLVQLAILINSAIGGEARSNDDDNETPRAGDGAVDSGPDSDVSPIEAYERQQLTQLMMSRVGLFSAMEARVPPRSSSLANLRQMQLRDLQGSHIQSLDEELGTEDA